MFDFGILDMSWIVTALDPGLALQIANWQNWAVFQLNHCNSSLRYSWMITQGLFTFTSTCDVTLSFNEQDLPVLTLAAYISDKVGPGCCSIRVQYLNLLGNTRLATLCKRKASFWHGLTD